MKQSEWISVKDRLPEQTIECLFYDKNYGHVIGLFCLGSFEDQYKEYTQVTHWQPIPDAPERD